MSTVTAVPIQPVKRGYVIWLWVGIVAAVVAALFLARQADSALLRESRGSDVVTTASGLKYKVLKPGQGGHPTDADLALVMYEGKLLNGTTFDKSQQPTPFPVAPGATVPGFAEALKLTQKGGKYRFWIPPQLGYGAEAKGPIPANSTLVFDLELIDFQPEALIRQMQMQQGMMGGAGAAPGGVPVPEGR